MVKVKTTQPFSISLDLFAFFALDKIVFEPEVSFKVTKIEKGDSGSIVYCEFVEDKGLSILKDPLNELGGQNTNTSVETQSTTAIQSTTISRLPSSTPNNPPSSNGLKFVDASPASLSEFLKIESSYKAVSLEDAAKKAGFALTESYITDAKAKKLGALKRVSKDFDMTEEDVMSIFTYTLEKKKDREKSPYRIVNGALANRTRENLLPLRDYIFYLLKGLRSFPRFRKENVLYRGVNMDEDAKSTYREGRTLFWTPFTSTSTEETSAYKFTGTSGVIFEIRGKFRGYSIGSLSKYEKEEGISFKPP